MAPTTAELQTSIAALQASLQEIKNEHARDRAELERRVQALESGNGTSARLKVVDEPEGNKPEEKPEDASDEMLEYALGSTIWEASAVIGMNQLGRGTSAFLALGMVLNAFVQIYLCVVFLLSEAFVGTHKYQDKVLASERWRYSVAHQLEQMDASGTSLAARVCGNDESLAVASSQAELLGEINEYIGLEAAELTSSGLGIGPLLCGVCLFLFVVLVMRELRNMVTSLLAAATIPRGPSRVEDGTFVSMSMPRLIIFFAMGVVRGGVAVALLITGILWLSSTSSTTDLILNAAALGFVMDLDELLLETMVPAKAIAFAGSLQPVPYRSSRFHLEAVLPIVVTFAVVGACLGLLVIPNMQDMLDVKEVLCGGYQDFVTTQTPVGHMVSKRTTLFNADHEFRVGEDLALRAVRELRNFDEDNPVNIIYSQPMQSEEDFMMSVQTSFEKISDEAICVDMDRYAAGKAITETPAMYMAIRQTTGVNAGKSVWEEPWTCADHVNFCDENGLLRNQCSLTCGCADPLSGLLLVRKAWGCPVDCEDKYTRAATNLTCADQDDVANHPGWRRYWDQYARFAGRMLPQHARTYAQFAAQSIAGGCSNMQPDPVIGHFFCDVDRAPFLVKNGLSSPLPFCLRTCCDGPNPPATCSLVC